MKDFSIQVSTMIPEKTVSWIDEAVEIFGASRARLLREIIVKTIFELDSSMPAPETDLLGLVKGHNQKMKGSKKTP